MYIASHSQLTESLAERRERRAEIRSRVDQWIETTYGIPNYSTMVDVYFGRIANDVRTAGVLCRQVGSIIVEDVTLLSPCA